MFSFPVLNSSCILCDSKVNHAVSLCRYCREDLPRIGNACKQCALPISLKEEKDAEQLLCGEMKFHQQLSAAAVLADLLSHHVTQATLEHGFPEAFIPVPLHKKRLIERGFNQSIEIIKPFASSKQIPVLLNGVERSKQTKTQTNLSKIQRKQNVSGCFTVLQNSAMKITKYSHIVIVDDVVTTGATTNELAKVLKQSGVAKVGVWSLARAEIQ